MTDEQWARYQKSRWSRWWQQKVRETETPFFASAGTTLSPKAIDLDHVGHYTCVTPERDLRVYLFPTQVGRDRFVFKYRAHSARPCGDPWP